MFNTISPVARTFIRIGILTVLLFALISCGTNATSSESDADTIANPSLEMTIVNSPEEMEVTASSKDGVFFPQQVEGADSMTAELSGKLTLDDKGCIRLQYAEDKPQMLVWPASFRVRGKDIRIFDGRDRLVGRVGENVRLGGGESSRAVIKQNGLKDDRKVSELFERCPGPYSLVADQ